MTSAGYSPAQLARMLGAAEPTAEQAAVISAPLSPLAVLAGAGSGKSETIAARLVWLVANQMIAPERVLGLTFTRKAAAELAERVSARLDGLRRAGLPGAAAASGDPVIATYHAYAGRLVADHALREGLEPSLRLITPAVAWQLAAAVVAAYDGPMEAVSWSPATVTAAVLDLAGELSEHLRHPGDVTDTGRWLRRCYDGISGNVPALAQKILAAQATREQLLPLTAAYAGAKQARDVIDFGDQMALAARIASRNPEVGAAERARYQAVLLDEYQDTSHAQLTLLAALFGGAHPVTAVGDPCQSIYGWRGASAGNLTRFAADFPGPGARPAPVRLLSTSFRNTGRVLDAAAAIQDGLRAQAVHVPRLVAPPGRAGRGAVVCALLDSAASEASFVAARVAALLSLPPGVAPDGQPWAERRADAVRPRDIAVLCRKRAQFPALRAALEERGIPVEVVGLGGLLIVPEVTDIVATLRVLHDPEAGDALARLLTSPRWRIGPGDLVALGRRARDLARGGQPPAGAREGAGDAAARAVSDLTLQPGSLVEALDDLGQPAAYSTAGYARFSALAAELRALRGHAGRPLPELVAEVERALSLDIEVAARPGADPAASRADLDAFADAAAAFAGDQEEPTLGAFLAYLVAAEEEEFGLEAGRVGDTDSVKLATVHAAKGLQWAAVIVPGLSGGRSGHVFPAKPRLTTRWTENPRLLPFPLRGDTADLPGLEGLEPGQLARFAAACTARELAEERRLAYVAATRAEYWLGCTGYWWGNGVSRLGPSEFLAEIRAACEDGGGTVAAWAPEPAAEAENPALAEPASEPWPVPPSAAGLRYRAVGEAGAMVMAALAAGPGEGGAPAAADHRALLDGWARDADLLLAERASRRGDSTVPVSLPRRLPVSSLVTMARDPAELARQVRRPMPQPPAPLARRGTVFHRWLEQRFGQQRLIDADDVPGAADDSADLAPEAGLAELKARFEQSEWADRWPADAEVPFEMLIGDRLVRGRIDAVFPAGAGGFEVVDWKTGRPPGAAADQRAAAVQLAAYRLAWAALAGVPVSRVRAAFHYVRDNLTVRPADLLDEAALTALIEDIPAG